MRQLGVDGGPARRGHRHRVPGMWSARAYRAQRTGAQDQEPGAGAASWWRTVSTVAPGRPRHARPAHPLTNGAFLALWAVQSVTQTAQYVISFALLVLAQQVTGSSAAVAFIILTFSLPSVLFGTFSGVLVDRWDKRRVMVWSNAIRGAAVLTYIFVDQPWEMVWVYAASFLYATSAQFFAPAQGAVIPKLIGQAQLIAANSLYNMTNMAAQFLGFTVVGWVMVRTFGLRDVFLIVFVLNVAATGVLRLIPIPPMKAVPGEGSTFGRMWSELLEGWSYIAARRPLLITILHLAIANAVFMMIGTLGPAFVSRIIKIRAEDLGILLAPAGVSALLGAVAVQRFARLDNRHPMIHAGVIGVGVAIMGLALLEPSVSALGDALGIAVSLTSLTALAVVLSMTFGFSAAFIAIPGQTVLQENSTDAVRGRVLATYFMVSNGASFFPVIIAGSAADQVGILETIGLVGALILAVGLVSHWSFRRHPGSWSLRAPVLRE